MKTNKENPGPAPEKATQRQDESMTFTGDVEDFREIHNAPVQAAVPLENQPATPEELAIARRVMSEDETYLDWGEDSVIDYSLMRDQFALPEPALRKKQAREIMYRWITRDPKRLDEMRNKPVPFRWWVVNRTTAPYLEGFFDPVLGCVSREDQMLVMKPWWMHEKEVAYKRGLADNRAQDGDILNLNGQVRSGVEFRAGMRSEEHPVPLGCEVRGGDIIMADEGLIDEG